MKAVIPAAGLGTRFLPLTKAQPKEMLPVIDKPCIQYVVEEAVEAGITDIVIITGKGKRAIEDHFDRSRELEQRLKDNDEYTALDRLREIEELADIFYIRQKDQLGLGHAILCAKRHIGREPFAVLLGDDLIVNSEPGIGQLIKAFDDLNQKSVVGIEKVPKNKISQYGVISGKEIKDDLYVIDHLIEKPPLGSEPSELAVIGRYILRPEIFDYLEKIQPGYGGEIQLTDALCKLARDDALYGKIIKGRRYDLGTWIDWFKANAELALGRHEQKDQLKDWLSQLVSSN